MMRSIKITNNEGNLEMVEVHQNVSANNSIINVNNRFTINVKKTLDISKD